MYVPSDVPLTIRRNIFSKSLPTPAPTYKNRYQQTNNVPWLSKNRLVELIYDKKPN